MIPVYQTRFLSKTLQEPPGNCFQACVASIMETTLEEIPDEIVYWKPGLHHVETWYKHYNDISNWLKERNLAMLEVRNIGIQTQFEDCYNIICGPSPRDSSKYHAVVGFGIDIVHDPHPDNTGLLKTKPWTYTFFIKIDPSK